MKLIAEASTLANLNPQVPGDLKRLHRAINEGREPADRIGDTYIYKKIYSERKKEVLNLDTRMVDLIALYVGYDTFSEFQASLAKEEPEPTTTTELKQEIPSTEEKDADTESIPAVVLGGGAPSRALHKQAGLAWTEQSIEEIINEGQATRAVVMLPPNGPEEVAEAELDRWDVLFRQAFHQLPLLFIGDQQLVQRWRKELPCVGWHRSASLQQVQQIQAFIQAGIEAGQTPSDQGQGSITNNIYGDKPNVINNPKGPITINNQGK